MNGWKTIAVAMAACALIVVLYPRRQSDGQADGELVTDIVYMGPGGPIAGAMDDAVREFERLSRDAHARDPSRPIYRVISGQNAARDQVADPTRLLIGVAGEMPPDVVYFDRYAVAEWAARGGFTPLDGYIERDLAARLPDVPYAGRFYESCWDEARYQGKVYGIPNSVDDRALIYNKSLLKRAGLVDESGEARPPRDWEELKRYAVKLTQRDERGRLRVVGFAPNLGNSWLYMFGWMAGGEFMSPDAKHCTLNDPLVVEGLAYMREVYDAIGGYAEVNAFQAGFQSGELDPFLQGKIAMKIDGGWQMPFLAAYGMDVDFGVAPPPLPRRELARGRKTVTWNGGWAYAIPATARHKEAAWEFIRFMSGERAVKIMADSARQASEAQGRLFIPSQSPMIQANEYLFSKYIDGNPLVPQRIRDGCRMYMDLLPTARYRPVTPVGQLLWNEHVRAMEAACYHWLTPQEALDRGTALVQRDLDRVLHPVQGRPINWDWFFVGYPLLLALVGMIVFFWDTRLDFRRRLAGVFRLTGRVPAGTVVGSRGGYFRRQWGAGLVFAGPWLIGFAIFGGGPLLFSILISLCDYDVLHPPLFIGLHNYRWMFSEDRLLPLALWNTVYMVVGVPLGMAVSLGVAMLLNVKIRGISVWRTFFYLPAIVPTVAASILWIWIFNPQGGLINVALEAIGVQGPLWLQDPAWSKPSLILMGLWGAGSGMIIWLAGLKSINEELYEAASLDGANALQRFRYVTIPQLSPYIFFNLVMGMIGAFQVFGQAFIMTQGGPVNSTLFYVYHLFNNAFRYGHMGYASAMAWLLFVIVMLLTIIQLRFSRRWVYYEAE